MQFAKKGSGVRSVTYAEAVEAALCYGWIDGQAKSLDETHYLQRFTPRKRDSIWSQINRQKALALIERGEMRPAGLAAIEQAKANGRWDSAYASFRTAEVPGDFTAALKSNATAAKFFATLDSRNRYAIIFRIVTTKTAASRAARIEKLIQMLEQGKRLHEKA